MSIKVMNHVWEHCQQKNTKLIAMLALADWSNDEGVSYPGVERLAKKCRVKRRRMEAILTSLEEDGEIAVIVHGGIPTKSGNTNRYYVLKYCESLGIEPVKIIPRHAQKRGSINNDDPQKNAGDDPQKNAGDDPQENAPKPSVEPSVEPSVTATRSDTTDSMPKQNEMFGLIVELFNYERIPMSKKKTIGKVAKELREAGYTLDEVSQIYSYVKSKGFSSMTPNVLTKYASEWNALITHESEPTTLDEWSHQEWLKNNPEDEDDLVDISAELEALYEGGA